MLATVPGETRMRLACQLTVFGFLWGKLQSGLLFSGMEIDSCSACAGGKCVGPRGLHGAAM
eukprot:3810570-Rhodomonas_salina.1